MFVGEQTVQFKNKKGVPENRKILKTNFYNDDFEGEYIAHFRRNVLLLDTDFYFKGEFSNLDDQNNNMGDGKIRV